MFFFKNHAENGTGRLVLAIFLFFQKALQKVQANGQDIWLVDLDLDIQGKQTL